MIFATYNRGDILESVFDKWRIVKEATKYTFEIICSDDASTDNTVEIIKNITDLPITLIENEKGGAGPARNAALKVAKGKIVIFTGDDMFPNPQFINQHYENFLKFGDKVATLGRIDWHEDIKLNHLMYHITEVGCEQFGFIALPVYQLIDFRHFYTSNISVPKVMLDTLQMHFRTDFDKYGFEDIELGYRLQKAGMKIYYDPSIKIEHHHVYSSVEKFCIRQETAGEELVVFNDMHSDLEDKCICDVDNCKRSFTIFKSNKKYSWSIKGFLIYSFMYMARKTTHFLEKMIARNNSSMMKSMCSVIYAGLFQFYFFFGCATRIAKGTHSRRSLITEFTYKYLKKDFAQIYWDIGYGFNETDSRKWMVWDSSYMVLELNLPKGVKELRVSPLKNKCIAWIKGIYYVKENGDKVNAKECWYNYCYSDGCKYDFTNTIDPQIVFNDVNDSYQKIVVEMSVKSMKKSGALFAIRRSAAKVYHKLVAKNNRKKELEIKYSYGQARRIQVGIDYRTWEDSKKLIELYTTETVILGESVIFSLLSDMQRGFCDYVYKPCSEPLDKAQMMQVVYTLLNCNYDYILVSKTYDAFPKVGGKCLDDVIIFSQMLEGDTFSEKLKSANGRYMRLPSFSIEKECMNLETDLPGVHLWSNSCLANISEKKLPHLLSERCFNYQKKKPMIFVFPIFLAVGGVERNTIETMRSLKEDYDFCMITMEHHIPEQGSLHYQLEGLCDYIFDLNEITDFSNYFTVLFELKKIFNPDIVWLCNNSPWLEDHFGQFRKLFEDAKIVAQDVYDTKVGWIEYYDSSDIITCDRFIAITELIKDTFVNKYHIPEEKIDVIYPVVDEKHIREERENSISYHEICKKYGVDSNKKHFSTVGRIAEQKNPLRYLRMVHQLAEHFEDVQFVIVGEGNLDQQVDDFIAENRMQEEVVRVPYISNAPEFIKILDGLIIMSDYEGMPIVSIEAMSFGVPVFSTDVGDLKRFINKTKGGMIIDSNKSDVENFEEFYSKLDDYKKNAQAAKDEILHFFSADYQANEYRKCFGNEMK